MPGLLEQIVFPIFLFWFCGLTLVLFRSDFEFVWKIVFVFVFIFYFFQYFPELKTSYERLTQSYPVEIVSWVYGIGKGFYFFLLFLWPVALLRIFYSASPQIGRSLAKTLVSATLFYWCGFLLYNHFSNEVDNFFNTTFLKFLNFSIK
ncbi:hypothetical protein ACO2J1_05130 [Leptospira interrogans]|uniref:Uncharacterized protein n=13 Tax=Leptospira interrogans TaxID=173 RepID=Q8F7Z1_LEPIN|nr:MULTISPECIES: hypothetical protein [Leptospira]EMY06526.1 hypothetical protein LEP1GSC029_0841 [Leptospira interrogans str. 2002000626]KAA1268044.1 hypothetical protein C5473_08555 [Leptospira interrogans serovar Weerasinghe]KAA1291321.1 hypothetical protein C4X99_13955 [Leptospira interrogans serovar Geyaweera]AAN48000.1 hypothetical protein LA_0801 [Leptospira interrogans serovar Lai str. 56601]AAS71372.1 conserved hypothetical protein [Leptospira interrogans serovar Copenhageni str. Fioc